MSEASKAREMLKEWKGDRYSFGMNVLGKVGEYAGEHGGRALLCHSRRGWVQPFVERVKASLMEADVDFISVPGARENAPREDLYRIALQAAKFKPESIIPVGGGSTIDACKAASVLASFSIREVKSALKVGELTASTIEPFFGAGKVTEVERAVEKTLTPVIAVQTAASSAAHLTKYSNITDPLTGQKKLIVDDAITPVSAVFDFNCTHSSPEDLTIDGGLDGLSHAWEVFMGATGKDYYETVKKIAVLNTRLILGGLPILMRNRRDGEARTALCLGTDLGGYAIMVGGTSGGHLGSFSLVDVLTHGRACAILNPYYTVFFSGNIQEQLRSIGDIYRADGLIPFDIDSLEGRELGEAVAGGMVKFMKGLGVPTTLKEAGATEEHLQRMLSAAKNPQLKMKLLNMPTPLDPDKGDVDKFMKPVLKAAYLGDFSLIKTP